MAESRGQHDDGLRRDAQEACTAQNQHAVQASELAAAHESARRMAHSAQQKDATLDASVANKLELQLQILEYK